ncbi:MAG TPA: hypothetical protein DIT99_18725 [Candidatus Latescibacteria bacterium]|nr:hypothetical protein [Candidatus Latescibacterota bacterium]
MGKHTHMTKAENIVYVDRDRPSGVVLPVISCYTHFQFSP